MTTLLAATVGTTVASVLFSLRAIRSPAIHAGAAGTTIHQCNEAGGKIGNTAVKPHVPPHQARPSSRRHVGGRLDAIIPLFAAQSPSITDIVASWQYGPKRQFRSDQDRSWLNPKSAMSGKYPQPAV